MKVGKLNPVAAKKLILTCVTDGKVFFSQHAEEEMENDGLVRQDVINVLRGGTVEEPEERSGTWRYRVRTQKMYAVVALHQQPDGAIVVTAWRL